MVDSTATGSFERWRSASQTRHVIRRITGDGLKDQIIKGDTEFMVSPEERVLNQSECRPEYDPFTNGSFEPVLLVEGVEDLHRFTGSANVITQTEIDELIGGLHWKTAAKRLAELDSPVALRRVLTAALDGDAGQKRIDQIRARLAEVAPHETQPSSAPVTVTGVVFESQRKPPQATSIYPQAPQGLVDGRIPQPGGTARAN